MATSAIYEIAETDELEALGRDDIAIDTSAGLGPEETVQQEEYEKVEETSNRSGWCIYLVVLIIALGVGATVGGVLLSLRGQDDTSSESNAGAENNGDGPETDNGASNAGNSPPTVTTTAPSTTESSAEVKTFAVEVIDQHPHDRMAFTQGFEYANGVFYESTGLRGQSTLRKVDIETGKVLQKFEFPDMTLFGEGMTLHTDHHIFMLTWQAGRGFVFNQTTFEVIKEWSYDGEGWGLCTDREKDEVYMSDGTHELRVLDPGDLSEKRRISVTLQGRKVRNLNEIEWICGEVWANVWTATKIYRIDPKSGIVKSVIDASVLPLKDDQKPGIDVLNGIAFDGKTGRLWLTGKKWPVIYQVRITDDSLDLLNCK